ncbi:MAG: DUF86 domain-containing protein [Chloroflexi bacterium]|nr:DUF86 domain-containing protein [Chloroflexota bacterium]
MTPLVEERIVEIERLCREHEVARLELFGSAATGEFRPGESDLDFLVSFEPRPKGSRPAPYFRLAVALQDLFGMDVDLVEEQAISNPYFRQAVDTGPRTPLYESPTAPERPPLAAPHPAPECSPVELRTKKLLYDINQAAGQMSWFTEGKALDDYLDDLLLRSAVERQFEIIGEGVSRLGRQDRATLERIIGFQEIIRFRNLIAHEYDRLENAQVWEIVERDITVLYEETTALLAE